MNVCVYELGSMSGARTFLADQPLPQPSTFFFFTKERFRISKCNIQRMYICNVLLCIRVSESERAVVASSGGASIGHRHAPAFIMMR